MESVEAVLRAPSDLEDVVGLAGLTVVERDADARLAQVVPGGLDEDPAGEAGAGLSDRAARFALARLVQRGDEPDPGGQLTGPLEAGEVADLERKTSAESVSMPRKQRSRATVGQWSGSAASSESRSSSAARRASSPSSAASMSR